MRFSRNQEIYGQGESGGFWCKVISGTVRTSKLRADGRRHIAEFCFSGDGFGLDRAAERSFSAEAVENITVMRYSRAATERLTEENPAVVADQDDSYLQGDLPIAVAVGEGAAGYGPGQFLLEVAVHQLGVGKNQGAAAALVRRSPASCDWAKGKALCSVPTSFL